MGLRAGVFYATYGHWTQSLLDAGYDVAWHYQPDITDPDRRDRAADLILQANYPRIPTRCSPVRLVCGSPPCIGFSCANPKSSPDHWANKNFVECFKKIYELDPDYFLVEMVEPIFSKGRSTLDQALEEIENYHVYWRVFEISKFGFPCVRKRVYFLGSKQMYSISPLASLPKVETITPFDILEPLREKWDNYEPDNYNLMSRYRKDGKLRAGPFSILLKSDRKIKKDKPIFTITGATCTGVIHYGQDRFLSLEEAAALMGFPPGYKFRTKNRSLSQVCQIIASGVDIRFTAHLLRYLGERIFNKAVGPS